MTDINLSRLKRYLKQRSKEELIGDIADLFIKFEPVQDYYQSKLSLGDDAQVLEKYKAMIRHEFFPARGLGAARLSVARKAISDYRKVSDSQAGLADMMLFYVEMGVRFTNTYGDIDEAFYASMERMYQRAVEFLVKQGMADQFRERCSEIVRDTAHIGWGFPDVLSEIYYQYFGS